MENNTIRYCMLCRRSEKDAGRLIDLPGNMSICQDCLQRSMDLVGQSGMFQQFPFPGYGPMAGPEESEQKTERSGDAAAPGVDETLPAGGEGETLPADGGDETTPERTGEDEGQSLPPNHSGFPGISIFNLGSMFGQQVQPRKPTRKKKEGQGILDLKSVPAPHKIKAQLDEYVVGQDHAKKILSVAVYNHYKRIFTNTMDEIEIEKSNVLMLGPTGCGKTYLVRTLARILDVPLAISDATALTEAGYIGDDIESVLSKLLAAADNDTERCEKGIVFIDEIDKIAKKKNTNQRDVSGESVQQGLLSMLEGSEVEVPVGATSKNAMVPMATINTRNILFICGGAFPGLEDVIKERLNRTSAIGFGSDLTDRFDEDPDLLMQAAPEDLRKFGMIPEFIGRLPVLCPLHSMTKQMLCRIMVDPKNAILRQYQKLLALDEVKLEFDESALEAISEKALQRKTGARGLRAVIEEYMLDIMYEIPKDENIGAVTITGDYINGTGAPQISIRGT